MSESKEQGLFRRTFSGASRVEILTMPSDDALACAIDRADTGTTAPASIVLSVFAPIRDLLPLFPVAVTEILCDEDEDALFDLFVPDAVTACGRDGRPVGAASIAGIAWLTRTVFAIARDVRSILARAADGWPSDAMRRDALYDPYNDTDPLLEPDYPGVHRAALTDLVPLGVHLALEVVLEPSDIVRLLETSLSEHAGSLRDAIVDLLEAHLPKSLAAMRSARPLERIAHSEIVLLRTLLGAGRGEPLFYLEDRIAQAGGEAAFAASLGMSLDDLRAFRDRFGV